MRKGEKSLAAVWRSVNLTGLSRLTNGHLRTAMQVNAFTMVSRFMNRTHNTAMKMSEQNVLLT